MHIRTIPRATGVIPMGLSARLLTEATAFEARCFETKERLKLLSANAVKVRAHQEPSEERQQQRRKIIPIRPELSHKERMELHAQKMRDKNRELKRKRLQDMQLKRWGTRG